MTEMITVPNLFILKLKLWSKKYYNILIQIMNKMKKII